MKIFKNFLCFIIFYSFFTIDANIPLFEAYPKMAKIIPHITLGAYPSPLFKTEELGKKLGIKELYVKDDGYSDDVKIPTGNKRRKLEFFLADAINKGYKAVCTVGSAGSNHALETAICAKAKEVGLNAVLVLDDQRNTSAVIRNLELMVYFGSEIIYAPPIFHGNDSLEEHAKEICAKNGYYFIPVGGSNELGSVGYVNAIFELQKQIKDMGIKPDRVYITLGSTGTAAGVLAAANAAGLKCKIIPVRISYTPEYKSKFLCDLVNKTGKYLKEIDESFYFQEAQLNGTQITIPGLDIEINHDCVGAGYAAVTQKAADAISLFYQATGKKLESTYTGKTFSALVDDANKGILKDKVVIFWNTFSYGNFEELINQVSKEKLHSSLPNEFIHYLTDSLQPYDQGV